MQFRSDPLSMLLGPAEEDAKRFLLPVIVIVVVIVTATRAPDAFLAKPGRCGAL
jgi:hypothetical protein